MRSRTQRQLSAGGVIVRYQDAHPEVCLIHRRQNGRGVWALPKGHVEHGEALTTTAVREVREETGLSGEVVASLGSITYWFTPPHVTAAPVPSTRRRTSARGAGFTVKGEQARCFKRVHFYLLRYRTGQTRHHDPEVEHAVWWSLDEALKKLSYENERKVLRKAQRDLAPL